MFFLSFSSSSLLCKYLHIVQDGQDYQCPQTYAKSGQMCLNIHTALILDFSVRIFCRTISVTKPCLFQLLALNAINPSLRISEISKASTNNCWSDISQNCTDTKLTQVQTNY